MKRRFYYGSLLALEAEGTLFVPRADIGCVPWSCSWDPLLFMFAGAVLSSLCYYVEYPVVLWDYGAEMNCLRYWPDGGHARKDGGSVLGIVFRERNS